MKPVFIKVIFSIALLTLGAAAKSTHNPLSLDRIARQESIAPPPNRTCNSSTEEETYYDSSNSNDVWICKNSYWIPYRLSLSFGSSKQVSGQSCKHIKDVSTNDCLSSKSYWVQEMEIYCEMNNTLDGGGWMLVWQHSYMEDLPLTTNMTFFSDYYKPCTQHATGWCNIPNKARFNPTEQMIVAYHNKRVIYAYKGVFNRNIDYDWTGAILMVHSKIIDLCTSNNGVHPNPVNVHVPGIAFSKYKAYYYFDGYGTIRGSLTNPSDWRWYLCSLPSSISSSPNSVQMTVAIYVR